MRISGKFTSLSTRTKPCSRRYYYPCFTDEKDEVQGQHMSKVFKSENDESWFGLKYESSMVVSLVDGECAWKMPRMCYLNDYRTEWTEWTKSWTPTYKCLVICVAILPVQQILFPSTPDENKSKFLVLITRSLYYHLIISHVPWGIPW